MEKCWMFTFFPVWFKLLGFHIRDFYHLTPCWSRSLSCIHSIVIICRRTLNRIALWKIPVEKCFSMLLFSTYPIKKSDFVTEIMIALHNYEKKIMKIKCHETHISPTTQVRPKQKENTRREKMCWSISEIFASATPPSHIRFIPSVKYNLLSHQVQVFCTSDINPGEAVVKWLVVTNYPLIASSLL